MLTAVVPPGSQECVPGEVAQQDLEAALDLMARDDTLFCGKYRIRGNENRSRGRRSCVQSIIDATSWEEYVVKFFFDQATFDRELELHDRPALRRMMAATVQINSNCQGAVAAPCGYVFPPFIVMDRGASLSEWNATIAQQDAPEDSDEVDIVSKAQALMHVTQCIAKLHKIGWAHRNLKPSNVLHWPRHHTWTLIDFGNAAKIGVAGYSLSVVFQWLCTCQSHSHKWHNVLAAVGSNMSSCIIACVLSAVVVDQGCYVLGTRTHQLLWCPLVAVPIIASYTTGKDLNFQTITCLETVDA